MIRKADGFVPCHWSKDWEMDSFWESREKKFRVGPLSAQHGLASLPECSHPHAGSWCGLAVVTAQSNAERKSRVSGSAVRFLLFFLWSSQNLRDSRSSKLVSCPLNKQRHSGRVKTQVQCQVESNTRSGMCVSSPRSLWITCYPMGKPWVRLAEPQLHCFVWCISPWMSWKPQAFCEIDPERHYAVGKDQFANAISTACTTAADGCPFVFCGLSSLWSLQ